MSFKLQPGLNIVSNHFYHSDKAWLSSSQLKTLLKSPAKFKSELDSPKAQEENASFQEGSLTHTLILEPQLVQKEYAFFKGLRKAGAEWEAFKKQYEGSGLTLMSQAQYERCLAYKRAFDANPQAVGLIKQGVPELSLCVELMDVPIKVRFDWIDIDAGVIMDVKTTRHAVDIDSFKMTCDEYRYDLSGALYSMGAEEYYKRDFKFYFCAISKQELECIPYLLGAESRMRGKLDIIKALNIYKKCKATNIWPETLEKKAKASADDDILEV